MQPITYKLPLEKAKEGFSSVLSHISTDDVTPVITCANFDGNTIVGTDRYTVARFTFNADAGEPVMLPRPLVAWVARMNLRNLLDIGAHLYTLTIEALPSASAAWAAEGAPQVAKPIRAAISSEQYGEERVMLFEHYRGNFPPVSRLFDDFKPAVEAYPVSLAPRMIERVTRFADQYHRERPVTWELAASNHAKKHPPIRATIGDFAALIQPNLILK